MFAKALSFIGQNPSGSENSDQNKSIQSKTIVGNESIEQRKFGRNITNSNSDPAVSSNKSLLKIFFPVDHLTTGGPEQKSREIPIIPL